MFDLSITSLPRGTEGSNPSSSSEESAANPESLDQAVLPDAGGGAEPRAMRRGAGGKVLQSVAVAVDNGATPAQTSLPEVVLVLHHPSHCEELEYCRIVGKMAPQSSRRLTSARSTPR